MNMVNSATILTAESLKILELKQKQRKDNIFMDFIKLQ